MIKAWQGQYLGSIHHQGNVRTTNNQMATFNFMNAHTCCCFHCMWQYLPFIFRYHLHIPLLYPAIAIYFCAAHRYEVPDPNFCHLHWGWPMVSGQTSPHWCTYSCHARGNLKDDWWWINKGTSPAASFRILNQAMQITNFVLSTAHCHAISYEWVPVVIKGGPKIK